MMRKLLVLANTLVQQDRVWTAHPPQEYSSPPSRRPARRAAVTDEQAEEKASKPKRREGRRATGRFEKEGHPLDMDTPGHGLEARIGVGAPLAVVQPQARQRHAEPTVRTRQRGFPCTSTPMSDVHARIGIGRRGKRPQVTAPGPKIDTLRRERWTDSGPARFSQAADDPRAVQAVLVLMTYQ